MAVPVFDFSKVSLRYPRGSAFILEDISLHIDKGEFIGIVGPTGCGKTSLLKVMAGVVPHYESGEVGGRAEVLGKALQEWTLGQLSERIGFVMEDPEDQVFNLRVQDEVTWGLENRGLPEAEIRQRADEALRFFGIERLKERVTFDLSGGEKQRLALASIYAIRPEVMLLDKPTSELDPGGTDQVMDAIRRLKHAGTTVVVVEDKIDFLLSCCDRVLLLANSTIQINGTPEQFARELASRPDIPVRNSDAVVAAMELGLDPFHFFRSMR